MMKKYGLVINHMGLQISQLKKPCNRVYLKKHMECINIAIIMLYSTLAKYSEKCAI